MRNRIVIELTESFLKVSLGKKLVVEALPNTEISSISQVLNKIIKQNKSDKNYDIHVVLNRNKITVRRVDLPSQDPKEIEQMLGLYLMRQIPYHKEEVCWAYENLGFDGISNSHIILAVALKNIFKNIIGAFTSIDILPESILMSSQGLLHFVESNCSNKTILSGPYMILDMDANYCDLVLVQNSKLGSSVVIAQGANQLKGVQEKERFAIDLKQALLALNSEIPSAKCEKLFLTGVANRFLLEIEDVLARDFKNLKAQYLSCEEYEAAAASGLRDISMSAVIGFGAEVSKDDIVFNVPELQIKKEMKLRVQQIMILGVSLFYILICLGGIGLVRLIQQQSYTSALKARAQDLGKDAKELEDITNKLKIAKQYVDRKSSVSTYLVELSRLCPNSVIVTSFNWEWQKNFSFKGYAQQIPDVLAFTNALSNSELFKGAQNRYTRRRKVRDKDVVDFEIVVK